MAAIEVLGHANEMGARLSEDLRDARNLSVAVAFAKESALQAIDLEGWAKAGRKLRLLAGTDFTLTDLGLLRRLEGVPGACCRIYHAVPGAVFHPKLYVLDKSATRVVYIGSSNLTRGGMSTNLEANVRIEGDPAEREVRDSSDLFEKLFSSEFAMPLSGEFEARYRELQEERHAALLRYPEARAQENLQVAEALLLGQYRATAANRRHLVVVTPRNYDLCMRSLTCGRRKETEINRFAAGDVFFFHLTGRGGTRAMGMFTGAPYYDDAEIWKSMDGGAYPWRRRFIVLGELRTGIPTRTVLEPLRPGAPKNWFNGFIQASHTLAPEDFEALRIAFENGLREERGLCPLDRYSRHSADS